MTVKTSYFDGTTYAAADDVAPWLALLADGVYNVAGGSFAVSAASPNNLSVNVAAGQAIKTGYFISSDAIVNVPITANTSGYNRIDNIVLNVDTAGKATTVTVQQGTPSSAPTAPIPAANQLVLAQVYVGNNVSVINSGNITDKRILPKVLADPAVIVASGSNANGYYIQYSDGTMICFSNWSEAVTTTASGSYNNFQNATRSFPATFLAGTTPSVSLIGIGSQVLCVGAKTVSPTTYQPNTFTTVAFSAVSVPFSMQAVGRWK